MTRPICFGLVATVLVSGCTTTKYVAVPPAEPPLIHRPTIDVLLLKEGDGPDVVIRAYQTTILKLQQYAKELELALSAYRTETTDKQISTNKSEEKK